MGDDRAERKPPGGGGSERSEQGGGGGRYEEAGPACKCRTRKESPIFMVPRETINYLQSLRGLELIIRLSIYSDLFFTHLRNSLGSYFIAFMYY